MSGPVLPMEGVPVTRRWTSQTSQTPKWLDEGQQSGAVYSNLVLNFLVGKALYGSGLSRCYTSFSVHFEYY